MVRNCVEPAGQLSAISLRRTFALIQKDINCESGRNDRFEGYINVDVEIKLSKHIRSIA